MNASAKLLTAFLATLAVSTEIYFSNALPLNHQSHLHHHARVSASGENDDKLGSHQGKLDHEKTNLLPMKEHGRRVIQNLRTKPQQKIEEPPEETSAAIMSPSKLRRTLNRQMGSKGSKSKSSKTEGKSTKTGGGRQDGHAGRWHGHGGGHGPGHHYNGNGGHAGWIASDGNSGSHSEAEDDDWWHGSWEDPADDGWWYSSSSSSKSKGSKGKSSKGSKSKGSKGSKHTKSSKSSKSKGGKSHDYDGWWGSGSDDDDDHDDDWWGNPAPSADDWWGNGSADDHDHGDDWWGSSSADDHDDDWWGSPTPPETPTPPTAPTDPTGPSIDSSGDSYPTSMEPSVGPTPCGKAGKECPEKVPTMSPVAVVTPTPSTPSTDSSNDSPAPTSSKPTPRAKMETVVPVYVPPPLPTYMPTYMPNTLVVATPAPIFAQLPTSHPVSMEPTPCGKAGKECDKRGSPSPSISRNGDETMTPVSFPPAGGDEAIPTYAPSPSFPIPTYAPSPSSSVGLPVGDPLPNTSPPASYTWPPSPRPTPRPLEQLEPPTYSPISEPPGETTYPTWSPSFFPTPTVESLKSGSWFEKSGKEEVDNMISLYQHRNSPRASDATIGARNRVKDGVFKNMPGTVGDGGEEEDDGDLSSSGGSRISTRGCIFVIFAGLLVATVAEVATVVVRLRSREN